MNLLVFFFCLLNISAVLGTYRVDVGGFNLTAARVTTLMLVMATMFQIPRWKYSQYRVAAVAALIVILRFSDLLRGYDSLVLQETISHTVLLLLFVFLYGVLTNRERIAMFIETYVWSSMVAFAVAVYQQVTGELPFENLVWNASLADLEFKNDSMNIGGDTTLTRSTATFFDPNFYGIYILSVLIFCVVLLSITKNKRRRWLIGCIFAANCTVFFLTLSRNAFLGLIVAIFCGLCLLKQSRKYALGMAVMVLVGIFATRLFMDPEWFRAAGMRMTLGDGAQNATIDDAFGRAEDFEGGVRAFLSSPIVGVGIAKLLDTTAHNVYLTMLAGYGIMGFGCFAAFFIHPVHVALRNVFSGSIYEFLVVGFLASTLVMYLGYDYFPLLETQYICFAVVYAVCDHILIGNGIPPQKRNLSARAAGNKTVKANLSEASRGRPWLRRTDTRQV